MGKESMYSLKAILDQVEAVKSDGRRTLVILPAEGWSDEGFAEAVRANRLECELRDRGYIANLIVRDGEQTHLYISW